MSLSNYTLYTILSYLRLPSLHVFQMVSMSANESVGSYLEVRCP